MVLAFRAPTGGDASTSADAEEYLSHADANSVLSLDGEVAKTTKNYDFPSLFDAFMSYSELGEFVHMFAWASSALVPVGIVDRDLAKTKSPREETEQSSLKKKTLADERSKPPSLDKTGLWWINGKEYDLTKWVDKHPGGRYLLEITKGTDCTELYESYHAPSLKQDYIRNTLEKYATRSTIAKPTATDQSNAKANTNGKNEEIDNHKHTTTYDWVNTPVYNDLKEVVREYNSKHGIKATDNWAVVVVWYGLWAVLHYTTLYNWLFPQSLLALGSSYAYLNAVLLGCTIWCFSTDMMHAGTHYQLCRNAVHSEWLGWLCGWMFCLPQTWIRQHVAGHHIHTNVLEKDPDLYHYQDVMNVHPDETRVPSSPWLFAIAPFTTQWVPSFFYTLPLLANDKWEGTDGPYVTWSEGEWTSLVAQWACLWAVLLCLGYHSVSLVVTPFLIDSLLYYAFSQVSHCNAASHVKHPTSKEFCVHQILTSSGDYSYASRFWTCLSIGLNNQGFHHCFPSVHSVHYSAIAKLALPVYEKHGLVSPGYSQSFWDSLRLHYEHLCTVNEPHWK